MIIFLNIVFAIITFFSFCGVIAEKDKNRCDNITICFGISVVFLFLINLWGGVL